MDKNKENEGEYLLAPREAKIHGKQEVLGGRFRSRRPCCSVREEEEKGMSKVGFLAMSRAEVFFRSVAPQTTALHIRVSLHQSRRYLNRPEPRCHAGKCVAPQCRARSYQVWLRPCGRHTKGLDSEILLKRGYFWLKFRWGVNFVKIHSSSSFPPLLTHAFCSSHHSSPQSNIR